jgi:hypothetical protein
MDTQPEANDWADPARSADPAREPVAGSRQKEAYVAPRILLIEPVAGITLGSVGTRGEAGGTKRA